MWRSDVRVAQICKEWSGALQEGLTDADNFGVTFESDTLSPQEKALLLAAVFLIDFMYFEDNEPVKNQNLMRHGGRGMSAFDVARQFANT